MNIWEVEWITFICLLTMLILSSFFSGTETALFSVSREQIFKLKKVCHNSNNILRILDRNPSGILAAILFANLTINVLFFCISASFSYRLNNYYNSELDTIIGVIALLSLMIFGEIIPKAIGMTFTLQVIRFSSKILYNWYLFLGPLRTSLEKMMCWATPDSKNKTLLSSDEFKILIDSIKAGDEFGVQEKTIVEDIITLPEVCVRQLMTPREKQVFLNGECTIEETKQILPKNLQEIFPVYTKYKENLIGYIEARQLLTSSDPSDQLINIIRSVIFVPETRSADSMLKDFMDNNLKIVGVVDEYGGLAGVLTLEDMLKGVVGSFNIKEDPSIKLLKDNTYQLKGDLSIREWRGLFIGVIPKGTIDELALDTVGGLVISLFKRIPEIGDKAYLGNLCFTVDQVLENRIEMITLELSSGKEISI